MGTVHGSRNVRGRGCLRSIPRPRDHEVKSLNMTSKSHCRSMLHIMRDKGGESPKRVERAVARNDGALFTDVDPSKLNLVGKFHLRTPGQSRDTRKPKPYCSDTYFTILRITEPTRNCGEKKQ